MAIFVLGSGQDRSKFSAQNERDSVLSYKKGSVDEESKQHRALTTVPTIMRLSVLALFIALPAAAYAAVCPQQHSMDFEDTCYQGGKMCFRDKPCCEPFQCHLNEAPPGFPFPKYGVCLMAHLLWFMSGIDLNADMQGAGLDLSRKGDTGKVQVTAIPVNMPLGIALVVLTPWASGRGVVCLYCLLSINKPWIR
jgi:hypothetical protein